MSVQARKGRALQVEKGDGASGRWVRAGRQERAVTLEGALYLGAIALGVVLRLLLLDLRPLSVEEGVLAAESHRIWQGQPPESLRQGPLPAFGTALALAMLGGVEGGARLLPALVGSALVAAPYLLRHVLGRAPALLAAYGIALSPVLLFASRDVGSGVIPAALALLLWWALEPGIKGLGMLRVYGAALLLAGLLASGAEGITALVALGVAAVVSHPRPSDLAAELSRASALPAWRRAAAVFVAGALALGTGLGTNLAGVQWVVVDVWTGWVRSFSLAGSRGELLGLLALYELPVLALGVAQLIRTILRRERTDMFLSLWAMVLLLLGMVQGGGQVSRVVLPLLPLYLLAARLVGDSLGLARAMEWSGRGVAALAVALAPAGVAVVLLTRASARTPEALPPYPAGELALAGMALAWILVAVGAVRMLVGGRARLAVAWSVAALVGVGYLLHTTAFLNYRMETTPREPLVGSQVSAFVREAGLDAGYFSNFFGTRVTVDPQLRPATEWYLRMVREVQYSAEPSPGISFQTVPPDLAKLEAGSERRPGVYTPAIDPRDLTWQEVWRWIVSRDGLVRPNQRDVIIRAPVGSY